MKTYIIHIFFILLYLQVSAQSSIQQVNDGLGGKPLCLFHDSLHQRLYIGGLDMRQLDIIRPYSNLMYLDNNKNWGYIDDSIHGTINTMTYYNGELYVGGAFVQTIEPGNGILIGFGKLQNDTMVKVQELMGVKALYRSKDNQKLYIAGEFTVMPWPQQYPKRKLLVYEGDTAVDVFSQFDNHNSGAEVRFITEYKDQFYIAGNYISTINSSTMSNISRWDGTQWLPLGQGTDFAGGITALQEYKGKLIVGVGEFVNTPHIPAIASWDGENWDTLSSPPPFYDYLMNGTVGVTHMKEYNGSLYMIVGYSYDPNFLRYCYRWDGGNTWENIAGFDGYVSGMEFFQDELYFCGDFSYVNGQPMSRIAKYSFMTGISDPLQPKDVLKVYPNPATHRLHIQLPPDIEGQAYQVTLTDMQGKVHHQSEQYILTQAAIDISHLPQGIYYAKVTTENGSSAAMWVKE